MEQRDIRTLINKQRAYFEEGNTLDVRKRINALRGLYGAIVDYSDRLKASLKNDLGKSAFESDMCEIRLTLSEISYMIRHIKRFSKPKRKRTPISQFASRSFILPSPYGVVLIMSPWNYPVLLTLEPLCDAIAAGNTAIIKGSAYSPYTTEVLKELVEKTFPSELVAFMAGGRDENEALLEEHFDYIFFTGSKRVGREVMKKASRHLTPVTLELGGKSPVIVERSADIALSARRIVFGKYLNLGQTCVAPDYVLVDSSIKNRFIEAVKREIIRQFGAKPLANPDYGKIINEKHFKRILSLIDSNKLVYGGQYDENTLQIEPTVMDNVSLDDNVMKEEIFGPILPVIPFDSIEAAIAVIKKEEYPLALYFFTRDIKRARKIMASLGFGGGCINDVVIHLATSEMGFGGFGESGMGAYHGKAGFDTFTHYKSIVDKKLWLDLPIRYQGYTAFKHRLINLFLK